MLFISVHYSHPYCSFKLFILSLSSVTAVSDKAKFCDFSEIMKEHATAFVVLCDFYANFLVFVLRVCFHHFYPFFEMVINFFFENSISF